MADEQRWLHRSGDLTACLQPAIDRGAGEAADRHPTGLAAFTDHFEQIIGLPQVLNVEGNQFGKPQAGTLLMQSGHTVGIDLPLKYLVWEDAAGTVRVGWNDPAWIVGRHGISDKAPVVTKMTGALNKFASEAASR